MFVLKSSAHFVLNTEKEENSPQCDFEIGAKAVNI